MIRRRFEYPPELGQELCSQISSIYVGTRISSAVFAYAERREGLRYRRPVGPSRARRAHANGLRCVRASATNSIN
jgi:hypothetical protein